MNLFEFPKSNFIETQGTHPLWGILVLAFALGACNAPSDTYYSTLESAQIEDQLGNEITEDEITEEEEKTTEENYTEDRNHEQSDDSHNDEQNPDQVAAEKNDDQAANDDHQPEETTSSDQPTAPATNDIVCNNSDQSPVAGIPFPADFSLNGQTICSDGSTDVRVETTLISHGPNHFTHELKITNQGSDDIDTWKLGMNIEQALNSVTGDAQIFQIDGQYYELVGSNSDTLHLLAGAQLRIYLNGSFDLNTDKNSADKTAANETNSPEAPVASTEQGQQTQEELSCKKRPRWFSKKIANLKKKIARTKLQRQNKIKKLTLKIARKQGKVHKIKQDRRAKIQNAKKRITQKQQRQQVIREQAKTQIAKIKVKISHHKNRIQEIRQNAKAKILHLKSRIQHFKKLKRMAQKDCR